jgi:hypothetical protein
MGVAVDCYHNACPPSIRLPQNSAKVTLINSLRVVSCESVDRFVFKNRNLFTQKKGDKPEPVSLYVYV